MSTEKQESLTNGHRTEVPSRYPPATATFDEVIENPALFWEKIEAFHTAFGSTLKIPTVGGRALDLHRLFVEVTDRGGMEKVIKNRTWKEVIGAFKFPTTITSASFVLRKYYLALLYHFEQVYYFNKQAPSTSRAGNTGTSSDDRSVSIEEEGSPAKQLAGAASPEVDGECSVMGVIDGKFDNGYLVTVKLGSEELKGVLYHVPQVSRSYDTSAVPPWKPRKRSRLSTTNDRNSIYSDHNERLQNH